MSDHNKPKKKADKKSIWKRVRDKSRERLKQFVDKSSNCFGLFQNWSAKHHLPASQQNDAALLLQQQIKEYQKQIENRQHGQQVENGQLRESDDRLPFERQPIPKDFFAQVLEEARTPSATEGSSDGRESKSIQAESLQSQSPIATPDATTTATTASNDKIEVNVSSVSEQTSSPENSLSDRTGHLTDVLKAIVQDAAKSGSVKEEEEKILHLLPKELTTLSRMEADKFDKIINENTKEALFASQPTRDEQENWNHRVARPHHMITPNHTVTISTENVESKNFCNSCVTRHVNYPNEKKSTRFIK